MSDVVGFSAEMAIDVDSLSGDEGGTLLSPDKKRCLQSSSSSSSSSSSAVIQPNNKRFRRGDVEIANSTNVSLNARGHNNNNNNNIHEVVSHVQTKNDAKDDRNFNNNYYRKKRISVTPTLQKKPDLNNNNNNKEGTMYPLKIQINDRTNNVVPNIQESLVTDDSVEPPVISKPLTTTTTTTEESDNNNLLSDHLINTTTAAALPTAQLIRPVQVLMSIFLFISIIFYSTTGYQTTNMQITRQQEQQPPSSWWSWWKFTTDNAIKNDSKNDNTKTIQLDRKETLTLRDIITDQERGFHLAMAPAFFGFWGYFGSLDAWYNNISNNNMHRRPPILSSVGASAGAITSVILGAGILPNDAAKFCKTITLQNFADFPGVGAVYRGNKLERIMQNYLHNNAITNTTNIEDSIIPVAVTAFDIQTFTVQILQSGSMARAARASATFPFLFQPVGYIDDDNNDYLFIDGGISDMAGLHGLTKILPSFSSFKAKQRVINLGVGGFLANPPPGPTKLPGNPEVISVSILGLPASGPWAMESGPKAYEVAKLAMTDALDKPLKRLPYKDDDIVHYELIIDASSFRGS